MVIIYLIQANEIQKLEQDCQNLDKNVSELQNKIQNTKDVENKKLK